MERVHRNERVAALLKILTDSPNRLFALSHFCQMFATAKSTLSEDLELLRQMLKTYDLGVLDSVAGPGGGVRFRPVMTAEGALAFTRDLCAELRAPWRLLPGGVLYMHDLLGDPRKVRRMANLIAGRFYDVQPAFVLTVAASGIPVALFTAEALGIPLVTARRDHADPNPLFHSPVPGPAMPETPPVEKEAAASGSAAAGRTRRLSRTALRRWEDRLNPRGPHAMSLPRRAVREGQTGLIVDDFMSTGDTVKGMMDLLAGAGAGVAGAAVVAAAAGPARRLAADVLSLLVVDVDGEAGTFTVKPSEDIASLP
ncbi:MAG: hypothetical protein FWF86_02960 [Clostridia bacterium]|nr:hypothetical protein [Clostridia bacterium]